LTEEKNRPLTGAERALAEWMLKNGTNEATSFLDQLKHAEVTPWKCACGCASFNLEISGRDAAPPGTNILGDFVFGEEDTLCGVFIYESGGILSGVEVYGLAVEAPRTLPSPEELRPF
jgi:hypothetical protein